MKDKKELEKPTQSNRPLAYQSGYVARTFGKGKDENPHSVSDQPMQTQWSFGWLDADFEQGKQRMPPCCPKCGHPCERCSK